MARLGIDYGTTNTVVAMHDRGLFTMVKHQAATGAGTIVQELFPSAILIENATGKRWYGLEADRRFAQLGGARGYTFVPSLKRVLHDYFEGQRLPISDASADGAGLEVADLLTGFLAALAESIRHSLRLPGDEPLETVITWPANANGAQRHITRRCFKAAGFQVLDTLNEPTASAVELADWHLAGSRSAAGVEPTAVAVFDLGGGTFDASVVWLSGRSFRVLASSGIDALGGDDFDRLLLDLFLGSLELDPANMSPLTRCALLRQVRAQKESISTGAVRSLFVNPGDFGLRGRPVSVAVDAYEERVRPLLVPAVQRLREVLAAARKVEPAMGPDERLTIYLVGGSSKLPVVIETVSAAFPNSRVLLTDKPFRSVAMGAAICSMDRVSYRDVFARHFGVVRLRDHGCRETYDMIFPAGTPVPRRGEPPLEKAAWYHPAHNIGHLRYLECTAVGDDGLPCEGARAWSDIRFPYDPARSLHAPARDEKIVATDAFSAEQVGEIYRCDADGVITVELRRPSRRESRCYEVFSE